MSADQPTGHTLEPAEEPVTADRNGAGTLSFKAATASH